MQNSFHFTAQDVFTLPATTDKIFAAPDKLLVTSLTKLVVQVLDLGEKGTVTHSLETQGVVRAVEYCAVNNHIATIEDGVLYVHQSWWSDLKLRVIGPTECFTWCQITGRLVAFDGDRLTIYDNLIPSFEVHGVKEVREVKVCDNIVALSTPGFVLVFSLYDEKYKTDDDEIIWNFDSADLIVNPQSLLSLPKLNKERSQSQIPGNFREAYFPSRPIFGLNLRVKNFGNDSSYQAKVILFKRIQPLFMQLIPYVKRSKEVNQDPLSPEKGVLEYVTFVLADATKCELFGVLGAEARGETELHKKPESFAVDECFLHILTESTLQTYSIPIPGFTQEWHPFLLGTHLMSMKSLLMSQDHLVVLSGRDMGDVTVYALLKPTTSEFYGDLELLEDALVLKRAEDVVRLQVRVHGEACSERLLDLYRSIEDAATTFTIDVLLEQKSVDLEQVENAVQKLEISELVNEEGSPTELGNHLLCKYPSMLSLILGKSDYISPKVLREKIAVASPEVALAISDFVCSHLDKVKGQKLHKKLLSKNIPEWVYELPPFDGRGPDSKCSESDGCICLRCTAGLLYGMITLANAPRKTRHEILLPNLPADAPDLLRLACLLPLTKSSSADPEDFSSVAGIIVEIAQKYTKKTQPEAPHLLTVLSDVLTLSDFLKCVSESSFGLLPWVHNGLMRERARKLKQEIVSLGSEIRPLLP